MNLEDLEVRGWERLPESRAGVAVWRKGWEPFCVELELTGETINGRLCAPGLSAGGTLMFHHLQDVESAATFLEKLLQGASDAIINKSAEGGLSDDIEGY